MWTTDVSLNKIAFLVDDERDLNALGPLAVRMKERGMNPYSLNIHRTYKMDSWLPVVVTCEPWMILHLAGQGRCRGVSIYVQDIRRPVNWKWPGNDSAAALTDLFLFISSEARRDATLISAWDRDRVLLGGMASTDDMPEHERRKIDPQKIFGPDGKSVERMYNMIRRYLQRGERVQE